MILIKNPTGQVIVNKHKNKSESKPYGIIGKNKRSQNTNRQEPRFRALSTTQTGKAYIVAGHKNRLIKVFIMKKLIHNIQPLSEEQTQYLNALRIRKFKHNGFKGKDLTQTEKELVENFTSLSEIEQEETYNKMMLLVSNPPRLYNPPK